MNNLVIRWCCLWLGQEEAHKQLILNITLTDTCFYPEYFVQANKSDVIISVSFWDFGCTVLSVLCRYFRNKDRPPWKKQKREWHRKRKRQKEYVQIYIMPLCPRLHMYVFLFSSWIFEQSYVWVADLLSLAFSTFTRHVWIQCYNVCPVSSCLLLDVIYIVNSRRSTTHRGTVYDDHFTLTSDNLRIHFMCSILGINEQLKSPYH